MDQGENYQNFLKLDGGGEGVLGLGHSLVIIK